MASAARPRWLVVAAVMLPMVMVVLDMTIVNVALPDMMGALGATSDQITWVLTSYIAASAGVIPLTGFLSARLGRRRLLLVSVSGFIAMSALCGLATGLPEMVLFRLAQGAFGGTVAPISQAIIVDAFPGRERSRGMAIWGVGVMVAPILGPTLGGYLTTELDWRWIFYINLPVGLLGLLLLSLAVPPSAQRREPVDWLGAVLLICGVGALQLVLDRGSQENWFHSSLIVALAVIAGVTLATFAVRGWRRADTIVRLRLLRNRNLAVASALMAALGFAMFSVNVLQPLMLERLLGYPAELAGIVMSPRGLGTAIGMGVVAAFGQRLGPRSMLLAGIALSAITAWFMTHYSLQISPRWIAWPALVQGAGMGMIFVTLGTSAYAGIGRGDSDQAAGIFNLARTLGSSAGISVSATVLARASQQHWHALGGELTPFNPAVGDWLAETGLTANTPQGVQLLGAELARQSQMAAYLDAFAFLTVCLVLLAPLALLLKRGARASGAPQDDTGTAGNLR